MTDGSDTLLSSNRHQRSGTPGTEDRFGSIAEKAWERVGRRVRARRPVALPDRQRDVGEGFVPAGLAWGRTMSTDSRHELPAHDYAVTMGSVSLSSPTESRSVTRGGY